MKIQLNDLQWEKSLTSWREYQYQFVVNNNGCVYQRKHSCWCLSCMSKLMQSTLSTWGDTYSIGRCVSADGDMPTIYNFDKQSCRKKRGLTSSAIDSGNTNYLAELSGTSSNITRALQNQLWLLNTNYGF